MQGDGACMVKLLTASLYSSSSLKSTCKLASRPPAARVASDTGVLARSGDPRWGAVRASMGAPGRPS